jgi:AcrR family transcriptional regulator
MARVTEAHVDARRNQILDGAWQCFAERGYHRATMQDVAAAAGLSAGTIYLYYESKEALLRAITERSQEMGRRVLEEVRAHADGPLGAIQALGAVMKAALSDPGFETTTRLDSEIWPEIIRDERLAAIVRTEFAFWREGVAELLRGAQEAGELRPDVDADTLAALALCVWEGLRHYRLIDPDGFSEELLVVLLTPLLTDAAGAEWPSEEDVERMAQQRALPWLRHSEGDGPAAQGSEE